MTSNSDIIRQRMTLAPRRQRNLNNSSYCTIQANPPMVDPSDYEVQVHVNFQTREMRLLKVVGASDGADVFLFTREKCRADCVDPNCGSCKTRKLYQDKAGDPQGSVPYTPHQEYLYCLRFDRQPITALLSLTPREHDVEVKEKGVLAYWFMKWLERAKILDPTGAVTGIQRLQMAAGSTSSETLRQQQQTPPVPVPVVVPLVQSEPPSAPALQSRDAIDTSLLDDSVTQPGTTTEDLHKNTSCYLPNMQVVYQVKKDQLSITLPNPEQLTRPLDVILVATEEGSGRPQSVSLQPGNLKSGNNLVALRNTAYTLKVQLHDLGKSVDLLDFITEHKILRVQESKDAPKQLNFLMERLVDQRGTFVLHITFDEKIVEVGTKPLGEFYLDVDVDSHRMMIGTIQSHASKFYRVEKVLKDSSTNILLAEKQVIFEGGVDPDTLTIKDSIPIERMSDYVISVVDPTTKQTLPTSVLAFQKSALFVKEIKNSDVRLHVTVQRQPSVVSQSSNANNFRTSAAPVLPIRRPDPSVAFHCPFRAGWRAFRIHHCTAPSRGGDWAEAPSASLETAETTTAETATSNRGSSESCFSLDVDLPALKARLVPVSQAPGGGGGSSRGALFIIYEESFDGKRRSTPCQLGQSFKVKHWCKYTVKCVEDSCLSPLMTFCLTDTEVTEIRPCNTSVRLTKRFVQQIA